MNSDSTQLCPQCGKPLPTGGQHRLCPACLLAEALASGTVLAAGEKPGAVPPPSPEEIAGKFPQFEIIECLGRGGMGVVYKARQKSLNRLVAIKILAPERERDARFAERFAREAELLAKLGHPHIVTIHDFGETGGLFYIVMEFVDGVNLRDLIRDGKLEATQALAIVPSVCEALQYAHDKGVVHRDIKPENLLLDREGRVKIADFGIASLVGDSAGERAGTPPYMAPEQGGAPAAADHRADIYALGVVLYEMLTGERPAKDVVAPSRKVHIDVRLDEIVLRALEKQPELRYASATEFRTRIETVMRDGGNDKIEAGTRLPPRPAAPRFSRTALVGAGFLLVQAVLLPLAMFQTAGGKGPAGVSRSLWHMESGVFVSSLLAMTVLGWVAVVRIGRAEGRQRGMWLALGEGILGPIVALPILGYLAMGHLMRNHAIHHLVDFLPDVAFRAYGPGLGLIFLVGLGLVFRPASRRIGLALIASCAVAVYAGAGFLHFGSQIDPGYDPPSMARQEADPIGAFAEAYGVLMLPFRMACVVSAVTFLLGVAGFSVAFWSGRVRSATNRATSSAVGKWALGCCLGAALGGPLLWQFMGAREVLVLVGLALLVALVLGVMSWRGRAGRVATKRSAGRVRWALSLGIGAGLLAGAAIVVFGMASARAHTFPRHQVPEGYEGFVVLVYDQPGFPTLPEDGRHQILRYPADGILVTASAPRFGLKADQVVETYDEQSGAIVERTSGKSGYESGGTRTAADGLEFSYLVKAVGSPEYWRTRNVADYRAKIEEAERKLRARDQRPERAKPSAATDKVVVEDLALRMLAAIRDKEDDVLRLMSVDQIKGWREALPKFAFEMRERFQQMRGRPFNLLPTDSLVQGDFAVVKCDDPEQANQIYIVLFFVKTADGWKNWMLRNAPPSKPLSDFLGERPPGA